MKFGLRAGLVLGVACAACAGDEVPAVDEDLANEIAAAYGGGTGTAAEGSARALSAAGGATAGGGSSAANAGGSSVAGAGAAGAGAGAAGSAAAGAGGTLPSATGSDPPSSAGGSAAASPMPPASSCDGFAILQADCGTSGCHGQGSNLGTFAASEASARTYIGKSGTVTCAGQGALLNPADPPASILVQKLGDSPPCGNHMPLAGALLSPAEVDCIEEWIGSL